MLSLCRAMERRRFLSTHSQTEDSAMSTRHYAFLITLLLLMARSAHGDIAGTWQLAQKPKVSVSVYGAPVTSLKLPKLPASDRIVFKADPGFPGTGTFQSSMFEGGWKLS
jgi:hypothetical protein